MAGRQCGVVLVLVLLVQVSDGGHHYQPLDQITGVVQTDQINSRAFVDCIGLCESRSACRYVNWSSSLHQCSIFRSYYNGESLSPATNLYQKMDDPPCPFNKIRSGACHCAAGTYGPACDKSFTNTFVSSFQTSMQMTSSADQVEIDGISYLIWAATMTNSAQVGYVSIYNYDLSTAQYVSSQTISASTQPSDVTVFRANDNYYLMVNNQAASGPQILYKFNRTTTQFSEIQRWTQNAIQSSAVYHRSNGDVYMCEALLTNTPSDDFSGPVIYKFNPTTEKFTQKFLIPDSGRHRTCAFVDINNVLMVVASEMNAQSVNMYHLNANETWTLDQTLAGSSLSYGVASFYSSSLNTYFLAFARQGPSLVSVFSSTDGTFNFVQDLAHSGLPGTPSFAERGTDLYLLADNENLNSTSFQVYQYAAGTFSSLSTVNAAGPDGGFKPFWYQDNLYLMVVNGHNGTYVANNNARYQSWQQLLWWK